MRSIISICLLLLHAYLAQARLVSLAVHCLNSRWEEDVCGFEIQTDPQDVLVSLSYILMFYENLIINLIDLTAESS
jgi:hypothetical protein